MTAEQAIAKANELFHMRGPGNIFYNWDIAVEFKDNPHRKAGEMWMVLCSDSDRVYAFVDEYSGDLLGVMQRRSGKSARYIE